jgi:hypothetical protein
MWTRSIRYALVALLGVSAAAAGACTGDCDGDGEVAINEAIRGVNIALGNAPVGDCAQFDANGDGSVAVNELIAAVAAVLDGCAEPTPSPTPDPDSPATLTIVTGAGNEFVTGRSYGFALADFRPGNIRIALYEGLLTEDHPESLAELRLTQTILDGEGEPVRDDMGRRRIVSMRFKHFPLQTGTFHCGEGLPATPGSLLTFDANVSLRNDELLQETILDDYFGYPRVTDAVDCTLTITSLDDGVISATFESHMLNAQADDLAYATGTLGVPKPTCTYPQLLDSPQTCYPWAF